LNTPAGEWRQWKWTLSGEGDSGLTALHRPGAAGALAFLLLLHLSGLTAAVSAGPALPLIGEALAVDPRGESLWLRTTDGEDRLVRLAPGAQILRDGRPATLAALRPVAPGFCHEVRVWLGADGRAGRVEGAYPGREGRVVAVGAGTVRLDWTEGGTEVLQLAPGCRVSRGNAWTDPGTLQPGEWAYVLCDFAGRAKNIALSE
jgi:hypothetical protein